MADFWSVVDAIGSFGGMVLAGIAGYVAYRLFMVESERDRKADAIQRQQIIDKLREQAASIGFWQDIKTGHLCIFNASPLPIYRIVTGRSVEGGVLDVNLCSALRPNELLEVPMYKTEASAKSDHRHHHLVRRPKKGEWTLWFADNANTYWSRNFRGELSESDPPWAITAANAAAKDSPTAIRIEIPE
ncbi:hypothetical protein [Catellatospora sp. NPDC049609]|uniref:hypothetical protein n=1 Tax=Catellatospora sp. NPDC049609 TaxID=3155505 RepID=UPI0034476325